MKKLLILLLLLLAGFTYLLETVEQEDNFKIYTSKKTSDQSDIKSGQSIETACKYSFEVYLNTEDKIVNVNESINWKNTTDFPTDEIHLNFFLNAFENNNTIFSGKHILPAKSLTGIDVISYSVEGLQAKLEFYSADSTFPEDRTTAKLNLGRSLVKGEDIEIQINYSFRIPKAFKNIGFSRDGDFFFFTDWYPKIANYRNGKWHCYPKHPYTENDNAFADYNVKLFLPLDFSGDAAADHVENIDSGNYNEYMFELKEAQDFCWFASKETNSFDYSFRKGSGKETEIKIYMQPESIGYEERYKNAVINSLKYFENEIGEYSSERLIILDVPRTARAAGLSFPNLITLNTDLISPIELLEPEKKITKLISEQYFKNDIAINNVEEAWLAKGLAEYFSVKILKEFYKPQESYFKLISAVPVPGLILSSYNEIPIIYTLGSFTLPEAYENISAITTTDFIGSISNSTYTLPDFNSVFINSSARSGLMFIALERYLGEAKLNSILKKYYAENKGDYSSGEEFWETLQVLTQEDMNWFIDNVFTENKIFDAQVKEIKKLSENLYELVILQNGDGIFKSEVEVYTENDTIKFNWSGEEKWKSIKFRSDEKIIAAQIDPERKNIFDIDYSNNSYTVEPNYAASISLSVRWFFWVQNAIMVLGSIG